MDVSELDYELPAELVAQRPAAERERSRLLVVDRATGDIEDTVFRDIGRFLRGGDCLVINDTRVIRARLHGRKTTGARVEIFLLHELAPGEWAALVRPSARVAPGTEVAIGEQAATRAWVLDKLPEGRRRVRFDRPDVLSLLERMGEIPLPPYVRRRRPDEADAERYQTVYARTPGAVAAPTAGLHYTMELMDSLRQQGVQFVSLTLHVGYGTFRPIQMECVEEHVVEPEDFAMPEQTAQRLDATRASGGRVIAVGTTTTRVLETQYIGSRYHAGAGITDRYIYPGYRFEAVDALQTNFHLPRSSLLALVCAFAGRDLVMRAYRYAIDKRFRFYSYGDAMLIL